MVRKKKSHKIGKFSKKKFKKWLNIHYTISKICTIKKEKKSFNHVWMKFFEWYSNVESSRIREGNSIKLVLQDDSKCTFQLRIG